MAPMRLMRAAVPEMVGRGWGRVVNVSSSSGKRPGQRNVAYSVAKAAELSLSRAYADVYAPHGVLINAIAPGPVGSELWLEPGGLADQTVKARGSTTRAGDRSRRAGALPIRGWRNRRRSRARSCSCARSGRRTSAARPGRSTAAPFRSSSEASRHAARRQLSRTVRRSGQDLPPDHLRRRPREDQGVSR